MYGRIEFREAACGPLVVVQNSRMYTLQYASIHPPHVHNLPTTRNLPLPLTCCRVRRSTLLDAHKTLQIYVTATVGTLMEKHGFRWQRLPSPSAAHTMMAIQELGERSFIRTDSCILTRSCPHLGLTFPCRSYSARHWPWWWSWR